MPTANHAVGIVALHPLLAFVKPRLVLVRSIHTIKADWDAMDFICVSITDMGNFTLDFVCYNVFSRKLRYWLL